MLLEYSVPRPSHSSSMIRLPSVAVRHNSSQPSVLQGRRPHSPTKAEPSHSPSPSRARSLASPSINLVWFASAKPLRSVATQRPLPSLTSSRHMASRLLPSSSTRHSRSLADLNLLSPLSDVLLRQHRSLLIAERCHDS